MVKKVFIIAGEASGDVLGSKLLKEFRNLPNGEFEFSGVGGQQMQKQNFVSIFPMEDLAVMGIVEVLPHLPKLINRINFTVKKIIEFKPDYVVTIDSPDFCFRVIKKLKKHKFFDEVKKIHLIAPSVWAYRESRAEKISKLYNLLLAILPFEPPYFEKYGLKTKFIGHPIIEDAPDLTLKKSFNDDFRKTYQIDENDKIILLTPGSRIGEVKKIFPEFIGAINLLKSDFGNITIAVPVVKKTRDIVADFSTKIQVPYRLIDQDHKKLAFYASDYAIAKSGTNAVEISMFKIPLIIAYKINFLTHYIIKKLVKIKYANLLNIISNREIVPELLQDKCQSHIIYREILKIMKDDEIAQHQISECQNALKIIGLGALEKPAKLAVDEIIKL